jgi:peptide/nickel transport system substrate-binding protein
MAVATAALSGLAACGQGVSTPPPATGDFLDCATHQNSCNSGTRIAGGSIVTVAEKDLPGWNLNDANNNTLDFAQIMSGVLPTTFVINPDYSVTLNTDLLESAEQTNTSPQTIVYKIKKQAVWSDKTPITADDFIWAWQTQSGTGEFCDPNVCQAASSAGYNQIKSVASTDGGSTVTVVFKTPFTDWKSLFAALYPKHVAADAVGPSIEEQWKFYSDIAHVPTWSGGPMVIAKNGFVPGASVTLVPNPNWYGAVKSTLDTLTYKIVLDQTVEEPALANGEVNMLFPQPNRDLVSQVRTLEGVKSSLNIGLNWEHIDLNLANKALTLPVRQAIFTAIDRQQVLDATIGQFDKDVTPLGSHMFVPGLDGYQDMLKGTTQGAGDIEAATKTLTEAGYKITGGKLITPQGTPFPTLRYLFTQGNTDRQTSETLVEASLAKIGIKVKADPEKVNFGPYLFGGQWDLVQFAWTGAPFAAAGAYQIWTPEGGSDFPGFSDPKAVDLIKKALENTDPNATNELLNQADRILTDANVVLPLFQKAMFLATGTNVVGIRPNGTQAGPGYNVSEWGLRANNSIQ